MLSNKKDRYTLIYSRKNQKARIYDRRIYNKNIYKPHFLDIVAQRCKNDIDNAKKRVVITSYGAYRYEPSKEYKEFLEKNPRLLIGFDRWIH